jgi:hypothetical protein
MSYKTSKVWTGSEWAGIAVAVANSQQKTISNQIGTTLTLDTTVAADTFVFSNSSPITVTIPDDASDEFLIGQTVVLIQNGTGTVSVTTEDVADLNSSVATGTVNLNGQYSVATLIKIDSDEWVIYGDIVSP